MPDPWGDSRDGRWYAAPEESLDGLLAALDEQAARSGAVITAHELDEAGKPGERWDARRPPPSSGCCSTCSRSTPATWGQLDIVCELAGAGPASSAGPGGGSCLTGGPREAERHRRQEASWQERGKSSCRRGDQRGTHTRDRSGHRTRAGRAASWRGWKRPG